MFRQLNDPSKTLEAAQTSLDSANPHLRGVITAMLDTACRPGEILSLQWRDVSLDRRELTIRAEKEKTRRERIIPISTRLMALLEMLWRWAARRWAPRLYARHPRLLEVGQISNLPPGNSRDVS